MSVRKRRRGFTLIEVVVALAILATTLYGGLFLLNRSVVNTQILQERTLAHWVAMNAYAEAQLAGGSASTPPVVDELVTIYGVDFVVNVAEDDEQIQNEDASESTISILTITVARADAPEVVIEDIVTRREML